jgi:hypothetical protein
MFLELPSSGAQQRHSVAKIPRREAESWTRDRENRISDVELADQLTTLLRIANETKKSFLPVDFDESFYKCFLVIHGSIRKDNPCRPALLAGELGDDGICPMLYLWATRLEAMAGIEPATVGLRSNPRLHHRRMSFQNSSANFVEKSSC